MFDGMKLLDIDGDGQPDGVELIDPSTGNAIQPGSAEAKKLWAKVDADAHSAENVAKAKALSGSDNATGMWMGRPLVPGMNNPNDVPEGDFQYLTQKLIWDGGHDPTTAKKIAASVKRKLYG